MSARQPGGAFTADVTGPEHGENGFAVFRRAWDTQTGEALPLPSLDTGERGAFRIGVRAARAHDAVIADVRFAHFRGRTSGPGEGGDRVLVHLMRQGSWRFTGLGGGEADVTVPDGSFLARRNGPPTSFDVRPGSRATVLILPPSVLQGVSGGRPVLGSNRSSEMRVLMAHARMVRETVRDLGPAGLLGARDALLELTRGALRREFDALEPRLAPALARAAMELADEYLAEPDLSPSLLARRLNVSVRTLHRAFATAEEPVAAYVRRRRLEQARRELLTPWDRPSIAEAAARWHFADSSHFARAFKKQYGEAPSRMIAAAEEERRQRQADSHRPSAWEGPSGSERPGRRTGNDFPLLGNAN
ncbi:helix-turn-helix domain-containing protein [Streptomyces griseoaurantiacus]|jgi:AraC-like DNA-binding protein|uniref:helix-turn-helix domain-containing protein n=1 Tax=Streptomyces griseoaurantiacus TaxID=68213 RepID=UPI0036A1D4B3